MTMEFSIIQLEILELFPMLTFGPITEFFVIIQSFPIITGPIILQLS